MSVARKCDICGDYFERDREAKTYNKITLLKMDNGGKAGDTVGYDICPGCSEQITNLLDLIRADMELIKRSKN